MSPWFEQQEQAQETLVGVDDVILPLDKVDCEALLIELQAYATALVGAPAATSVLGSCREVVIFDGTEDKLLFGPIAGDDFDLVLRTLAAMTGKGVHDKDSSVASTLYTEDAMDETADLGVDQIIIPVGFYFSQCKDPKIQFKMNDPLAYFAGGTSGPTDVIYTAKAAMKKGLPAKGAAVKQYISKSGTRHAVAITGQTVNAFGVALPGSWGGTISAVRVRGPNGETDKIDDADIRAAIERFESRAVSAMGTDDFIVADVSLPPGSVIEIDLSTAAEIALYACGYAKEAIVKSDATQADAKAGKASIGVTALRTPSQMPLAAPTTPSAPRTGNTDRVAQQLFVRGGR